MEEMREGDKGNTEIKERKKGAEELLQERQIKGMAISGERRAENKSTKRIKERNEENEG
jgi:hypothetical protein